MEVDSSVCNEDGSGEDTRGLQSKEELVEKNDDRADELQQSAGGEGGGELNFDRVSASDVAVECLAEPSMDVLTAANQKNEAQEECAMEPSILMCTSREEACVIEGSGEKLMPQEHSAVEWQEEDENWRIYRNTWLEIMYCYI